VRDKGSRAVPFRQSKPELSALQTPSTTDTTTVTTTSTAPSDAEDLEEKKDSLEHDVRFYKNRLEAARKRLDSAAANGASVEETDKLKLEVDTAQSKYEEAKAELTVVNSQLEPAGGTVNGPEVIVPGENLDLWVVEDPSFNGKYAVRRGGYIIIPQVGRVPVAGKTIDQAEGALKKALQSSQLQRATVMIEPSEGTDVDNGPLIYLTGEFKHPRPFRIPQGTSATLVNVLLSSDGFTDTADLSHVKVMRMTGNKSLVEEVNVQGILDGKGLGSDMVLTNGDVIKIPTGQLSLVYVTGNVKSQGSYKLVPGQKLTAYGVILQSGGFSHFADQKKVHVLRAMPDGTKVKIPVDVVAVKKGTTPDVQLQINDIVVVPEKFFSF
jgi:polysaccharide export outer membrane protein